MQRILCFAFASATAALVTGSASAQLTAQTRGRATAPGIEVFRGPPVRTHRAIAQRPDRQSPAWSAWRESAGGTWRALWDVDTRIPALVFGSGLEAPAAIASPDAAIAHAQRYMRSHMELLAPGSQDSDFALVANHLHDGVRTVAFQQHHRGVPVRGGALSFTFKRDRLIVIGSTAWPYVALPGSQSAHQSPSPPAADSSRERAGQQARSWVASDFGADAQVVDTQPPVIVGLKRRDGAKTRIEYTHAHVLTVATQQRPGRFRVYLDQATGEPIIREPLLHFGTGQLLYNTPDRWPGGTRSDRPAAHAETTVDGELAIADEAGFVSWVDTGNPADLFARPRGPYVWVEDQTGADPVFNGPLTDGGSAVWNAESDELTDAMLTTFAHLWIAKARVASIDASAGWLAAPLRAEVNLDQACNAFYDSGANSLHFYQRGQDGGVTCANTGRLADVIYHEFGHALHDRTVLSGQFDLAFSEGASDYFAATITGDPAIGVGFFESTEPLRHIDPAGREYRWPDDIDTFDAHNTGLIFAGAMWDLRTELIAAMGDEAGVAHADALFYSALQRTADIPSSYAFILAADDDDGDLANGTPNQCAIDRAFGPHGLVLGEFSSAVTLEGPIQDGLNVYFLTDQPDNPQCPVIDIESATIDWRVRGDVGNSGSQSMSVGGEVLSAGIPDMGENLVIQYRITVVYDNGTTLTFPDNPADPYYELFQGALVELYCTDFESDPFAEGWTSFSERGLDSWAWGVSTGAGQDPASAYSGDNVVGTNLVTNGYPLLSLSNLASPVLDVSAFDNVRLQYRRWLNVEDGRWDNARILANGETVWENLATENGLTNHRDREWRFHDIDVTELAQAGALQVRFQLESDDIIELGGWTIDDVCIVSYMESVCGDGILTTREECDDGAGNNDQREDACRNNCVAAYCGDGVTDSQEQCDDGNNIDTDTCSNACIGENPPAVGCCNSSPVGPDTPVLCLLVALGLAVILRRRQHL